MKMLRTNALVDVDNDVVIYCITDNSLFYNNNQLFAPKDYHNDEWSKTNCAVRYYGAWWFNGCYTSNLNGKYFRDKKFNLKCAVWRKWPRDCYSLKAVQIKIRPNAIN